MATQSQIKPAARKLPIKRNPNPQTTPPISTPLNSYDSTDSHPDNPPFKFHRIWSEPDEIRFLQGLLGCASQNLVFPRDLNIFYDRFSDSMPQPFTRTQLSEKLRRLRKKFKVMSARIEKGQDPNRLALHDRDLLHLCTRLWDPNSNSTSPFNANDNNAAAVAVAVAVAVDDVAVSNKRQRVDFKLPEMNDVKIEACQVEKMDEEEANAGNEGSEDVGCVVRKSVLDAFDESLSEFRERLGNGGCGNEMEKRWKEQRVAELDVFAKRMRLMLEEKFGN